MTSQDSGSQRVDAFELGGCGKGVGGEEGDWGRSVSTEGSLYELGQHVRRGQRKGVVAVAGRRVLYPAIGTRGLLVACQGRLMRWREKEREVRERQRTGGVERGRGKRERKGGKGRKGGRERRRKENEYE